MAAMAHHVRVGGGEMVPVGGSDGGTVCLHEARHGVGLPRPHLTGPAASCIGQHSAQSMVIEQDSTPATMPKITYIEHDGVARTVEAEIGATVMETALKN